MSHNSERASLTPGFAVASDRAGHTLARVTHDDTASADAGPEVSVLGSGYRQFPVQPGLRDGRAINAFTNGQCHALAFAVHEATRYPIFLLIEPDCDPDPFCQPVSGPDDEDSRWCCCQILHLGVITPAGLWLDITGAHPVPEFVSGWEADHEMHGLGIRPATEQALAWISRSTRWRRPEMGLARSFVAAIVAEAQALTPDP